MNPEIFHIVAEMQNSKNRIGKIRKAAAAQRRKEKRKKTQK